MVKYDVIMYYIEAYRYAVGVLRAIGGISVANVDSLSELSNEELVRLCKEDKASALTELILRFNNTIRMRAESFSGAAPDDLAQEGFMALLSAVRTYDPDRNASFMTYAQQCIRNRMITCYTRSKDDYDELPEELELPDDPAEIPENKVLERSAAEELYRRVSEELSELELSVLQLYLSRVSYSEIGEKLGISQKSVDNAVQRIRRKLRNVL